MTTGTVFGNPVGGSAKVQLVPAAVPRLMMPGAPLNGTRTTVFVPTTCSASVCAGPVFASVTGPSPVQVAANKTARGLFTGSARVPLAKLPAVTATKANANAALLIALPPSSPQTPRFCATRSGVSRIRASQLADSLANPKALDVLQAGAQIK